MKQLLFCVPLVLIFGCTKDEASVQVAEIENMTQPKFDESLVADLAYREMYIKQIKDYEKDRNARIKDLYSHFANNPQVKKLMLDRWINMAHRGLRNDLLDETTPLLNVKLDPNERLDLLYVRAEALIWPPIPFEPGLAAVEEFVKAAPQDERGAELLYNLALGDPKPERQVRLFERAAAAPYKDTIYYGLAHGAANRVAKIGKPFELSFNDLISDQRISVSEGFKGKIVVIEFWASWCGGCIAAMPENNQMCAEYKDRGVEFVGVSLDSSEEEGGLTAFKKCIDRCKITWPQYYQGNGIASEFSSKWGIAAAPTVFVIDRDGNLASTTAAGKIKAVIDEMLRKDKSTEPKRL
jgi:thiol-disulfide isomerase/thioredoxin